MPLSIKKDYEYVEEDDALTEDELRVVTCFKKHIELMLKDDWYITIEFTEIEDEEPMQTDAQPEYRKAHIEVDLNGVTTQWEYLDNYVRHELLHILVWNFFDIAGTLAYKRVGEALRKLEESVIDRLEHMPLWEVLYKS